MLRVEAGQLDAERFESLLADGSRAREAGESLAAAELLRDALALWRGDALADFIYEPFAQGEIARLEELRLSALEERIEADLGLGRHAALVGELEGLVREHPLRERLRAQLMLALYRAGRQADALEVYRAGHTWFAEELGIVPGSELQRLEGAILRQDAELEPPTDVSPELAAPAEATPAPETRKTVTVLVARTRDRGRRPEALRTLDEGYLDAASAIERHGGSVESVLGDRVLAVFGVPRIHEDDALRARSRRGGAAGRSGRSRHRRGGDGRVRVGELVACWRASHARESWRTPRPRADPARRRDHRLLGDAARVEPAADGDQPAWRLLEVVPGLPAALAPARDPARGPRRQLASWRERSSAPLMSPRCILFTILGAAGIGKTRLAEEFASTVADEATVLAGRCVPYGEGITFWPCARSSGSLTTHLLARLLAGEEDAVLVADRLTEAIGQTQASTSVEEIFWAFRRLLETISRDRPGGCRLRGRPLAEAPTLLDLIEYLAAGARRADPPSLPRAPGTARGRPGWGAASATPARCS